MADDKERLLMSGRDIAEDRTAQKLLGVCLTYKINKSLRLPLLFLQANDTYEGEPRRWLVLLCLWLIKCGRATLHIFP
jgi:hypothetical protein